MKKVLFILFVMFTANLLCANGSLETDQYKVQMDESCTDPELLMSPEGDMYFFYIKDSKLIIEKKGKDESEFSYIENTFFDTSMIVKSIKRFRMSDDTYSLLALTSDGINDALYHFNFDDNKLLLTGSTRIDNALPGLISDYNLYATGHKEFVISYLNDHIFYYTYINRYSISHHTTADYQVSEYKLFGMLEDESFFLKGYIYTQDNTLFIIKIDQKNNNLVYVDSFDSDSTSFISDFFIAENSSIYILTKGEGTLHRNRIIGDEVVKKTYDRNNDFYYKTYTDKLNIYSYEYSNSNLLFNESRIVTDVDKYEFSFNNLFYLTSGSELYIDDLINVNSRQLIDTNLKKFNCFEYNFINYIVTVKEELDFLLINKYKESDVGIVKIGSLSVSKNKYDKILNNIDSNKLNIIFETDKRIIKSFKSSCFASKAGKQLQTFVTEILITRIGCFYYIEVIK